LDSLLGSLNIYPASALKNDFGNNWDAYVQTLFRKAIDENIKTIGVTDYFLLEGYKKLCQEYLDNPEKLNTLFTYPEILQIKNILVLPNIEFRLKKFISGNPKDLDKLNRKLNFHVIFSNEMLIDDIEQNFLNQLHFDFDAETGEQAESKALSRANLELLGKKLKLEHENYRTSGKSDLHIGMMNAAVDESEIAKVLNTSLFKNKFLTGPNPDEDLSKVSWDSQGHNARKIIIKQAHFVFSSNPKTIQFMAGDFHESREKFISEFGELKPCLWGSDAHSLKEVFCPTDKRYTWIKSDLTFDGLKQVVYDPDSRVRIQESSPQQKSTYQTIDSVRFLDNRDERSFGDEWIPVSPDLTTIVGGKSSGKSLLLHHIAKAINSAEVKKKSRISSSSMYEGFKNDNFDFEVKWSNGEISRLSEPNSNKPITYIPQLYINHLAEKDGREHLNQLIRDILSQNPTFTDYLGKAEQKISEFNQTIANNISALFVLRENYIAVNKDIDSIGVKVSISNEIINLKKNISKLREKSGFTETEDELYKSSLNRLSSLKERKEHLINIAKYGQHISEAANQKSGFLVDNLQRTILAERHIPKNSRFVKNTFSYLNERVFNAITELNGYKDKRLKNVPHLLNRIDIEILKIEKVLEPLSLKVKDQSALIELSTKLNCEEDKIKKIEEREMQKKSVKEQGDETNQLILIDYKRLIECYMNLSEEVDKPDYQPEEDIIIQAEISFDNEKFDEFVGAFDRRGNIKDLLGKLSYDSGKYDFEAGEHADRINDIFSKLKTPEGMPTVRKGVSEEEMTKRLFSDCFSLNYIVNYNGDEITLMSPGKRGLVLLNLLLHLSNATHPILIDQPEDNLDNRTIYDQLKGFVRQRKQKRQILMVTHNANLVVAADSECVIVANQDGQNVGQDNLQYKFEYCSGAIENSFDTPDECGLLNQKGIRQHICEILEGGVVAFKEREMKYGLRH